MTNQDRREAEYRRLVKAIGDRAIARRDYAAARAGIVGPGLTVATLAAAEAERAEATDRYEAAGKVQADVIKAIGNRALEKQDAT